MRDEESSNISDLTQNRQQVISRPLGLPHSVHEPHSEHTQRVSRGGN